MPRAIVRPSTLLLALVAGAILVVLSAVHSTPAALALTNCSVSDSFDSEEQAFLNLINQYRAQNGRGPLTVSANLNRSSAWMARDLATKRYFSHTDSLGRSFSTRLSQCEANPNYGENIAAGTYRSSAQDAFTAWRNSSGHNANMLNGAYRQIGIARYYDASSPYRWYWVTDFSTSTDGTSGSSGGSSQPVPTPTQQASPPPPSAPVQQQAAKITSPANGSTLSTSQVFQWKAVSGAQGYRIYIGTSQGAGNLLTADVGTITAVRISGFPATGGTVYIRLATRLASGWVYSDYSYRLPR